MSLPRPSAFPLNFLLPKPLDKSRILALRRTGPGDAVDGGGRLGVSVAQKPLNDEDGVGVIFHQHLGGEMPRQMRIEARAELALDQAPEDAADCSRVARGSAPTWEQRGSLVVSRDMW